MYSIPISHSKFNKYYIILVFKIFELLNKSPWSCKVKIALNNIGDFTSIIKSLIKYLLYRPVYGLNSFWKVLILLPFTFCRKNNPTKTINNPFIFRRRSRAGCTCCVLLFILALHEKHWSNFQRLNKPLLISKYNSKKINLKNYKQTN